MMNAELIGMPLDDHLLRNERILAAARAESGGVLYATNQRVLLYRGGVLNEEVYSLYYSHIVSVAYRSKPRLWLIAVGTIFLVADITLLLWQNLPVPFRFLFSISPTLDDSFTLLAFFLVLGMLFILVGILYKQHFYELIPVASVKDRVWRTADAHEDTKRFARFVEDQIASREEPLVPEANTARPQLSQAYKPGRQSRSRGEALVKCEYCGALIPEIAIYCPKCGTKRK
jgi:hypothetical protein